MNDRLYFLKRVTNPFENVYCSIPEAACDFEKYYLNFPASSPAYGINYRITGGFLNAAISILKRVTGKIFTISTCFHRSKPKLYLLISP
jgi:hypothetical protein